MTFAFVGLFVLLAWLIFLVFFNRGTKVESQKKVDIKKEIKSNWTVWQKFTQPAEEKHANEIANGTVKIMYPKYNKLVAVGFYVICVLVFATFIYFGWQFLEYLLQLKKTCQTYMGYSASYLVEMISIMNFTFVFFTMSCTSAYAYFKLKPLMGSLYPPPNKQPLFSKNICRTVDSSMLDKSKEELRINISGLIMLTILSIFRATLFEPLFPISQANEAYQQACVSELAKEMETDEKN